MPYVRCFQWHMSPETCLARAMALALKVLPKATGRAATGGLVRPHHNRVAVCFPPYEFVRNDR